MKTIMAVLLIVLSSTIYAGELSTELANKRFCSLNNYDTEFELICDGQEIESTILEKADYERFSLLAGLMIKEGFKLVYCFGNYNSNSPSPKHCGFARQ